MLVLKMHIQGGRRARETICVRPTISSMHVADSETKIRLLATLIHWISEAQYPGSGEGSTPMALGI